MMMHDAFFSSSWGMLLLAHTQYDKNLGRIEKWVLRKAFDDEEHPYLPEVRTSSEKAGRLPLCLCVFKPELTPLCHASSAAYSVQAERTVQ